MTDKVIQRREVGGSVDILYREVGDGNTAYTPIMDTPRHTTAFEYDVSGNPVYIGKASFGASKSASVWQIQKLVWSGSDMTDILWADGDPQFDNVWNNRASLSYS